MNTDVRAIRFSSAGQPPLQLEERFHLFISRLIPHIPPKAMQIVRYAGLYAHNVKRKFAEIARTALEALRLQFPLFNLDEALARNPSYVKSRPSGHAAIAG